MQRGKIPIRRAQLITNFGPGALTITPDGLPLLVASLDEWYIERPGEPNNANPTAFRFEDLRLQTRLGVSFFRLPPEYVSRPLPNGNTPPNFRLPVPAYLFPRWYVCTRCERLKCFQPNDGLSRQYTNLNCDEACGGRYIPVPLVAVCEHGHIQDFPFRQWVHQDANPQCNLPMRLSGVGGSVEQQQISCDCNATRRLTGVLENNLNANPPISALTTNLQPGHLFACRGLKAWAGAVQEPCNNPLVAVLSAGTNVYYSDVRSSIFLPAIVQQADAPEGVAQDIIDRIQSVRSLARTIRGKTQNNLEDAWNDIWDLACETLPVQFNQETLRINVEFIVNNNLFGQPDGPQNANGNANENDYDEKEFRFEEYQVLASEGGTDSHHLKVEPLTLNENGYLRQYFSKIAVVKRMRETRALVGFSRLRSAVPQDANNEAALTLAQKRRLLWRNEPIELNHKWLPGFFVHGEGIFFEIRDDVLNHVATSPAAQQRMDGARPLRILERTPRFIALHTLSHMLIRQLCFECGYGATALRERLYCRTENGNPMHGILIYTAQSDSEGAMGGLVRMGTEAILERILKQAIEEAKWCSSDPVCRETGSEYGQGIDKLNGAACHSCCHLPETSCECFNSHLDRNLIFSEVENFRGLFNDHNPE
jgi:hypothetical protein